MPESSRTSRGRVDLDPLLIHQVQRISWVWLGLFVAAATVTTATATQLKTSMWFVLPGGRITGPTVHALAPWGVILIGWAFALGLVTAILVSRELTWRRRAWPMVVVMLIGVLGALYVGALVTGSLLQLGHPGLDHASAQRSLAGIAELVGDLALVAALVSLVVVPGVAALRRRAGRRSPRVAS